MRISQIAFVAGVVTLLGVLTGCTPLAVRAFEVRSAEQAVHKDYPDMAKCFAVARASRVYRMLRRRVADLALSADRCVVYLAIDLRYGTYDPSHGSGFVPPLDQMATEKIIVVHGLLIYEDKDGLGYVTNAAGLVDAHHPFRPTIPTDGVLCGQWMEDPYSPRGGWETQHLYDQALAALRNISSVKESGVRVGRPGEWRMMQILVMADRNGITSHVIFGAPPPMFERKVWEAYDLLSAIHSGSQWSFRDWATYP